MARAYQLHESELLERQVLQVDTTYRSQCILHLH